MSIYDWVDARVVGTPSTLRIDATLRDADIVVGDPLEWSVFPVPVEKRICSSFDDCTVLFYECHFIRI